MSVFYYLFSSCAAAYRFAVCGSPRHVPAWLAVLSACCALVRWLDASPCRWLAGEGGLDVYSAAFSISSRSMTLFLPVVPGKGVFFCTGFFLLDDELFAR